VDGDRRRDSRIPPVLTLVGRLNKTEMQRATTDLLIFDIPVLIAYITRSPSSSRAT
jgi:2-keto-4-pentenoate hydratase/2-oxohepta-3-ene-1,7-dioic acid hydratase in catechol pathway